VLHIYIYIYIYIYDISRLRVNIMQVFIVVVLHCVELRTVAGSLTLSRLIVE